jgi:signal peptidase II
MKNTKTKIIEALKWFYHSLLWVFILIFILDIVTKQIANSTLALGESVTVIPGFLSFTLVHNTGAGFGIFGNVEPNWLRRTLLIGVSLVMSIAFFTYYGMRYKKLNFVHKLGLILLAAGAFGNLIDRAFYPDGNVIDFIDVDLGSYKTFPVFNIADCSLSIGVVYLVIVYLVEFIIELKGPNPTSDTNDSLNNGTIQPKIEENPAKPEENNNVEPKVEAKDESKHDEQDSNK